MSRKSDSTKFVKQVAPEEFSHLRITLQVKMILSMQDHMTWKNGAVPSQQELNLLKQASRKF